MSYISSITMLLKFGLGISLIVAIHELGHMLFAKLFGMDVKKYMIGFPPKIASFRWRGTEYALGAIPLGGFVEIAGMADASNKDKAPKAGDFRSKPKWQQLVVMLGGIIFNLLSAFIIYTTILCIVGTPYLSKKEVNKYGIYPTELGTMMGLVRGDKVIKKDDQDFERFGELQTNIGSRLSYTLVRGDKEVFVSISPKVIQAMQGGAKLMQPLVPFALQHIVEGSIAERIGLKEGDRLVAINDMPTTYVQDLETALLSHAKKEVVLTFQRGDTIHKKEVILPEKPVLGIVLMPTLLQSIHYYSVPVASVVALQKMGIVFYTQAKGIGMLVSGKLSPSKTISGPIGMMKMFGNTSGFTSFWMLIFLISLLIAFMNALPIPPLDGGNALILLYEMITKKDFPVLWRSRLQLLGVIALLGLMLFSLLNDIYKLL